jgi:hypothetical protein
MACNKMTILLEHVTYQHGQRLTGNFYVPACTRSKPHDSANSKLRVQSSGYAACPYTIHQY